MMIENRIDYGQERLTDHGIALNEHAKRLECLERGKA